MKQISKIALALSMSILMMHTLLPHDHSYSTEKAHFSQCTSSDGLLDIFRQAFHLDQGANHLEEYQAGTELELLEFIPASIAAPLLMAPEAAASSPLVNPYHVNPAPPDITLLPISFRGPPNMMA